MSGTIIIFCCHGGKECVRNKPSYRVAHPIFPPSFKLCISIIPRYMSWIFSNILSWRGHRIAKLVAEYLGSIFRRSLVSALLSRSGSNAGSFSEQRLVIEPTEYRAEEFSCAIVPYVSLKEVAHGMVCLSESRRGLNFRDVICARHYYKSV